MKTYRYKQEKTFIDYIKDIPYYPIIAYELFFKGSIEFLNIKL